MTAINTFEEILICVRKVYKFSQIDSNNETPQSPYQEKKMRTMHLFYPRRFEVPILKMNQRIATYEYHTRLRLDMALYTANLPHLKCFKFKLK